MSILQDLLLESPYSDYQLYSPYPYFTHEMDFDDLLKLDSSTDKDYIEAISNDCCKLF